MLIISYLERILWERHRAVIPPRTATPYAHCRIGWGMDQELVLRSVHSFARDGKMRGHIRLSPGEPQTSACADAAQ